MENKLYCVYIYVEPITKTPIYVGKGTVKRSKDHIKLCRKKDSEFYSWLRALMDAGKEPIIELIHCRDEQEALLQERFNISKFGRKDKGKGTLLNKTNGGNGMSGFVYSEETKKKKSESMKMIIAKRKELGMRWGPTKESAATQAQKLRGRPSGAAGKVRSMTPRAIARRKKEMMNGQLQQHYS